MKINSIISSFSILAATQLFVPATFAMPVPQDETNVIYIDPLFQYPVAPEELMSLEDKSNWLMDHFWEGFDFKAKQAVDQNALNDAFNVYAHPMRWADRDHVIKSTDNIISAISKNPVLLMQFTKAAEENLYGPRAIAYIDEIYVKYLEAIDKNKKINPARKARYGRQLRILKNSMRETVPPAFDFTTPTGAKETFRPGLLTVIEFGDPDCMDCRQAKLKMDTDLKFSSLVEKGLINVLFIIPDPEDGWEEKLADYPRLWHTGASDEVSDIYDLRSTPYFYVIGTDGKIQDKTESVEKAMTTAIECVK
ncbi:MAG: DUF5106 domain-containing protein [Bacteroides sp.]|nr:DUF5106 domain-containing protein [Bacteroides sp.]